MTRGEHEEKKGTRDFFNLQFKTVHKEYDVSTKGQASALTYTKCIYVYKVAFEQPC